MQDLRGERGVLLQPRAERGLIESRDQVPHPRVLMFNKDMVWVPAIDPLHFDKPIAGVGLGTAFGRAVAHANPAMVVGLVPAAVGGTSLDQRAPGGELYSNAVARTRAALTQGRLVGILWHQGEADSAPENVVTYTQRFERMILRLRTDLEAPDVPVIIGETGRFRPNAQAINAVLASLPGVVHDSGFVSAEGLSDKGDKLHFDAVSMRILGQRYADAWSQSIATGRPSSIKEKND